MALFELSEEQKLFIEKALEKHNILVDACIGSGKTTAIQQLCNIIPKSTQILYLTYNRLLKLDAKEKIKNKNVTVTNYHGFAWKVLRDQGIPSNGADSVQIFNHCKPPIHNYDLLIIDEYQDIEQELAELLEYIKSENKGIQIIAVGDMEQKIYDKTALEVPSFIDGFLGNYLRIEFTQCFRLPADYAATLGRIWEKKIVGVNENCHIQTMNIHSAISFLSEQETKDILCLGMRNGIMTDMLNQLETLYPEKFNKNTVYASIADNDEGRATKPKKTSAIFTTYDSSKGMERKTCVICDFTELYWHQRISKPQISYSILRNIFCVAASRGKNNIIFVQENEAPLSEKTLSTYVRQNLNLDHVDISKMFDFKFKEDIEYCYSLLKITPSEKISDFSEITIKNTDGLIDLSPCIGTYQEAVFFNNYNIDVAIDFLKRLNPKKNSLLPPDYPSKTLDEKILILAALETKQNRYYTQVNIPFVFEKEKLFLIHRLSTLLKQDDFVQVECRIDFAAKENDSLYFSAFGLADVVKDGIVYELKFVSELSHTHFLQCACYMIALNLEKGILWNTRKNELYEIEIPDIKTFMNAVASTITKQNLPQYFSPKPTISQTVSSDTLTSPSK